MISGIMPCSKWDQIGYPWRQAIPCWSRVCDEIILVVHNFNQAQAFLHESMWLNEINKKNVVKCEVNVRTIVHPELNDFGSYGSYLMYGVCLASNPDWMIAVEADYLISPAAAVQLRNQILMAPSDTELITARAVTMSYTGTDQVYLPDFKNWFTPYDGFTWERPIASRVSAGVYPGMYIGVDRHNNLNTCEGFIRLRPGIGWGATYHTKNLGVYGTNGFNILDTKIEFEHLTFTKNVPNVLSKMQSDGGYFTKQNVGLREILEGHRPQGVMYPELEQVKLDYADREMELRERMGI